MNPDEVLALLAEIRTRADALNDTGLTITWRDALAQVLDAVESVSHAPSAFERFVGYVVVAAVLRELYTPAPASVWNAGRRFALHNALRSLEALDHV